jgi:hypothetical protein
MLQRLNGADVTPERIFLLIDHVQRTILSGTLILLLK